VISFVNGHEHNHRVTAFRPTGGAPATGTSAIRPSRGFWEINTASHIDYPQQSRLLDLFDNATGRCRSSAPSWTTRAVGPGGRVRARTILAAAGVDLPRAGVQRAGRHEEPDPGHEEAADRAADVAGPQRGAADPHPYATAAQNGGGRRPASRASGAQRLVGSRKGDGDPLVPASTSAKRRYT
jgi:hypothetical protein